jgi:hypothetical protein
MAHDIAPIEQCGAVNSKPLAMPNPLPRDRDLRIATIPIDESPQGSRGEVTQHRSLAEALDSGE